MFDHDVVLHGAPDASIGSQDPSAVQVMQIDMTQDFLDELLQCARNGKPPQVVFGRNPVIRYDGKSQVIEATPDKFRNELYIAADSENDEGWQFSGLIHHTLAIQRAQEAYAGMEKALETLKNNVASIEQEKEARKPTIEAAVTGKIPSKARNGLLRRPPALSGAIRSYSGSPSLAPLSSPAPTSTPSLRPADLAFRAARTPLVHLLAIGPLTERDVMRKLRIPKEACLDLLKQVGKQNDTKQWQLTDRAYKELDPYKFPYASSEDREKATDNAIRSFDRMRLSREDNLWQMLLPHEQRGKGIVLSRLKLRDEFAGGANTSATLPKKTLIDKKTGLPKKTAEAKKSEKAKEKKQVKDGEDSGAKKLLQESRKNTKSVQSAQPPLEKKLKVQSIKKQQSRESRTPDSRSSSERKATDKMGSSTKKVPQSHKPKNPSPLSASPPVNASDFEDDHQIHKTMSASPRPTTPTKFSNGNSDKALKRKANDLDSNIHAHDTMPTKQRKVQGKSEVSSAEKSTTSSSNGTLKRKMLSSESEKTTPTKHIKVNASDTPTARRAADYRQPQPGSSPVSDSSTSPPLMVSWRQSVEMARRFQNYYERYAKLWHELASAPEPPSAKKREELERMHKKLGEMKTEIKEASLRH